jgi:hypothetical protein
MPGGSEPPQSSTPAQTAFTELAEKRRLLAQQDASIRAQIRAVEQAQKVLEAHSQDALIRLEFTKNEAGVLGATCYHFAAHFPQMGVEMCTLLNRLGDDIFQAMCDQNADFAQRLNRLVYGRTKTEPAGADTPVNPDEQVKHPPVRLPKKSRPYLRYSDAQIEEAKAKAVVGSDYDYLGEGYVRLHLNRTALLEMYRRPRHLKIMYAYLLRRIDAYDGYGGRLFPIGRSREPGEGAELIRSRPYERLSDGELKAGLKRIALSPGQVKFAYGFLAVSLRRSTLLHLYRSRADEPGIAYLIKVFDERLASHRSSGQTRAQKNADPRRI